METRIYPMNLLPMENEVTEIAPSLQQAIPGCGFRPTEEELIINYLKSEVPGRRGRFCIIPTLDNIYQINPWDLPAKFDEKSEISSADQQWWFICPQTQNQRISRKTPSGFSWKITGKHKDIKARNEGEKIGSKITLVFLDGQNSKGAKSNWVMHELHPHPDNTGFVLCWLKRKQDEKADNQEPSIQVVGNQSNDSATAKNEDIPSIPQFQCPEVAITELSKKVYSKSDGSRQNGTKSLTPMHEDNHQFSPDQEHIMWTKYSSNTANSSGSFLAVSEPSNDDINFPHPLLNVDVCSAIKAEDDYTNQLKAEMSGTSYFIGEQADKSWNSADCENPEQLPFAEQQVQEMQNQLTELITNGLFSSTEVSSGTAITKERSRIESWMSPRDRDSFLDSEFFDLDSLISEPETGIGEFQYGQLGQSTNWQNHCATKNWWSGSPKQQGSPPLQEDKGYVKPKLGHPRPGKDHNSVCIFRWSASKSKGDTITMPPKSSKNDKGKVILATSPEPPTKSQIHIPSIIPVQTRTQILEEEPLVSIIPQELSQLAPQSPEETVQTWTQVLEEEPLEPIIPEDLSQLAPQSPEETIMLLPHTLQKSKLKTSSQAIELSSNQTPLATSGNKLKRNSSEVVISLHATPPKSRSRFYTQDAYLVNSIWGFHGKP